MQFLFCYIESDGGGNSFDLEREVRAEFAVDVAFDFFFCAYFDGLCLIILDTFMQANVFAREDTDEKRYEFCPAALIDEYDVEHPVVDLGREDIGEACYGTAVKDEEHEYEFLVRYAVYLKFDLHRAESRYFADTAEIVCHFTERVFEVCMNRVCNTCGKTCTDDVDEVAVINLTDVYHHGAVFGNGACIRRQITTQTYISCEIVRRSARQDTDCDIKFGAEDLLHDEADGTVTARDEYTFGRYGLYEFDESRKTFFARAIRNDADPFIAKYLKYFV